MAEVHPEQENCLYHSKQWRNKFQFIANSYCRKVIPRKYLPFLWKYVCTCTDFKSLPNEHFDDYRTITMQTLRQYFQAEFSKWPKDLNSVESLLLDCSSLVKDPSLESRWRLLLLLKYSLERNYQLLDFDNQVPNYTYFYGRPLISNAKYYYHVQLELAFPLEYIPHIIGTKGQHLRRIRTHYDCDIRIQVFRYGVGRMSRWINRKYTPLKPAGRIQEKLCRKLNVDVYYNSAETFGEIRDALVNHICQVVRKREKHELNEKENAERRLQYLVEKEKRYKKNSKFELRHGYSLGPGNAWKAATNRKLNLVESYNRQAHHRLKSRRKNSKPVLKGGTCKNCQQPVRRGTFTEGACQYHPGFLVDQTSGMNDTNLTLEQTNCISQDKTEEVIASDLEDNIEEVISSDLEGNVEEVISSDLEDKQKETIIFEDKQLIEFDLEDKEGEVVTCDLEDSFSKVSLKVKYVWSCCGEVHVKPESRAVDKDSHKSGCVRALHEYRPPKSAQAQGRKRHASKKKLEDTDDYEDLG